MRLARHLRGRPAVGPAEDRGLRRGGGGVPVRPAYLQVRRILKGEYYVLGLFALLGIMVLVSANSLVTLYLGVELLALSLYALVAFDRDSGIAAEAAIKYFVLGAIASGTLLYGMSMRLRHDRFARTRRISSAALQDAAGQIGLLFGLAFIVVGVAFKFGAVPFHMWVPDVYHGAPTTGDAVPIGGAEAGVVRAGVPAAGRGAGRRCTRRAGRT